MKVLGARRRLPQSYPELKSGGVLSRQAVLYRDLGLLATALDAAISRALTASDLEAPETQVLTADDNSALYSIRLPKDPGAVQCAGCLTSFDAAGPTGHVDDEPICDHCFLVASNELGMVLALVAKARAFSREFTANGAPAESTTDFQSAVDELGRFCCDYERVAARYGPVRHILTGLLSPCW
jgi:hypothetical protein